MRTALVSFLVTGLVVLLNLGSGVLLARFLGPDGRGQLGEIMLWPGLIAALGMMALNDAMIYRCATGQEAPKRVFAAGLVGFARLALAGVALGYLLLPTLYGAADATLLLAAAVYLAFIPLNYAGFCVTSILEGKMQFGLWNLMRLLPGISYLALLLGCNALGYSGVVAFAVASLLSMLPALLVGLLSLAARGFVGFTVSAGSIGALFRYGWPVHLGAVAAILSGRLDQMVISQWLSSADFGFYLVAIAVVSAVPLFPNTLSVLSFPKISAQSTAEGQMLVLGRYLRFGLALALVVAVAMFLLADWLVQLLFGAAFTPAVAVLRIALLGAPLLAASRQLTQGLKAMGKTAAVARGESLGLATNAVALLLLVGGFGLIGVAWAYVATRAVVCLYLLVAIGGRSGAALPALLRPTAADVDLLRDLAGLLRR